MTSKAWARVCLFVFVAVLSSGTAWSQTNGTIRGTVLDQTGAVVPGTAITVKIAGTDTTRSATADKDGAFDIPEVAIGTYELSADAKGFKKFVAKDIVVSIGHVSLVTVNLQLGGSTETVTVEANAVQVETTSTQLGGVMTDQSIRELPLNTRNAYQLLQLQPGVQSQLGADLFLGTDNPGVVSVNGGRGRSNNYMVNGGDANDIFINGPSIQPSPDAIEEFRVLTNTFDAEYGRNSGSVVNVVTKSGTNAVHGDFYEFNRNNAYNTREYITGINPDYKQNQFGGTIGGPIKKDRTFIFASYEGNRLIQGISSGSVILPTTPEAMGNFSEGGVAQPFSGMIVDPNFASVLQSRPGCSAAISAEGGAPPAVGNSYAAIFPNNTIPTQCFDPTAQALYNRYVAPLGTGNYSSVPNNHERGDQFTVRFDHKLTNTQQLSVYYYFDDDNLTDAFSTFQAAGANVPGFGANFTTRAQQWNISHTWTIGSTAVNEFRFTYFREGQAHEDHPINILNSVHDACGAAVAPANCFSDPGMSYAGITANIPGRMGVPLILVNGGFSIGNNFEGELPQAGNSFQWMDSYTKTFSKHTAKFGIDVLRQEFNQFVYYDINGDFNFTNAPVSDQIGSDPTFPAYPAYFLGTPNGYTQGAAQGENDRNTGLYLFAQDSYKIKPNLTLNYGLRWELNTPYYDTGNRLQTYRPGQISNKYPCLLNPSNVTSQTIINAYGSTDCSPTGPANAVFPTGLVFPGDPGVPRGLTQTYYKGFAPRIGLAWSPGWTDGWLAKLTGGPGKSSVRMGYGIFYNPIEELVMEQFSAEPPFGGSTTLSSVLFNLPFQYQAGGIIPNPFVGVINQPPNSPVDWANFRPILLFGEFQPKMKLQYADQYNLTIERQLTKDMLMRVAYVGTQAHHLLGSYDENYGHAETCIELNEILGNCGPYSADVSYFIPPTTTIPAYVPPVGPGGPPTTCSGLYLPYNAGAGGNCIPAGTLVSSVAPNGINLVGLRKYSSPRCQPLNVQTVNVNGTPTPVGVGCPADGIPVFSSIYVENTIANSNYNGLQISFEKSYSHGLLFQASYTFSKAIDQGASFENELNPLNFGFTRGLSLLDAKHRFVFSPVWDIPAPHYDGFKGKVVDGWGASAIITYQSGFPIRIQDPDDTELQNSDGFFEGANTPTETAPVQFLNPKKNGNFWFNPSNFTDSTVTGTGFGTFGNTPHALCCGPALSDTDLVISKKTPINERWNSEFRAEFYNAWNHTQFANPDGNFADSTFGQILKTRESPRVIQFGLKILF
jgi:hypothetical protein